MRRILHPSRAYSGWKDNEQGRQECLPHLHTRFLDGSSSSNKKGPPDQMTGDPCETLQPALYFNSSIFCEAENEPASTFAIYTPLPTLRPRLSFASHWT